MLAYARSNTKAGFTSHRFALLYFHCMPFFVFACITCITYTASTTRSTGTADTANIASLLKVYSLTLEVLGQDQAAATTEHQNGS